MTRIGTIAMGALVAGFALASTVGVSAASAQTVTPSATTQLQQGSTESFGGFLELDPTSQGTPVISLTAIGPIMTSGSIALTPGPKNTIPTSDGNVTVIHERVTYSSATTKTRYSCHVTTEEFGYFRFDGGTKAWRGAYSPHRGDYYLETSAYYYRLPGGACPNPNVATPIVATLINFDAFGAVAFRL